MEGLSFGKKIKGLSTFNRYKQMCGGRKIIPNWDKYTALSKMMKSSYKRWETNIIIFRGLEF